jgi:hypothetical protein
MEENKFQQEKERLIAETLKLNAERVKVELETLEISQRLNGKWFKTKNFIQAIVAGLVAIPLIWFFVTQVAIPLHQSENIKLTLANELANRELDQKELKLNKLAHQLDSLKINFLLEIEGLRIKNQKFKELFERTFSDFAKLNSTSKNNTKEQYKAELNNLNARIKEYASLNLTLQNQISKVTTSTNKNTDPTTANAKVQFDGLYMRADTAGYWQYIRFFPDGKVVTASIISELKNIPKWLTSEGNLMWSGTYKIDTDNIEFTTTNRQGAGSVEYKGRILPNLIVFSTFSHINNFSSTGELFKFVKLPPA